MGRPVCFSAALEHTHAHRWAVTEMDCWRYWYAMTLCECCTNMDQWWKEMRGKRNVKVPCRVIGIKWHLQLQINLIRARNKTWQTERKWLTLSFFRFNYHIGRDAAVITVVNASADIGSFFSSKFLDGPISFYLLLLLVIGQLINPITSRCFSAHEDAYIYLLQQSFFVKEFEKNLIFNIQHKKAFQ